MFVGFGVADVVSFVGVDLGVETVGLVVSRDFFRVVFYFVFGSFFVFLVRAVFRGFVIFYFGWTGRTGKGRRFGIIGLGSNFFLSLVCCVFLGE